MTRGRGGGASDGDRADGAAADGAAADGGQGRPSISGRRRLRVQPAVVGAALSGRGCVDHVVQDLAGPDEVGDLERATISIAHAGQAAAIFVLCSPAAKSSWMRMTRATALSGN